MLVMLVVRPNITDQYLQHSNAKTENEKRDKKVSTVYISHSQCRKNHENGATSLFFFFADLWG